MPDDLGALKQAERSEPTVRVAALLLICTTGFLDRSEQCFVQSGEPLDIARVLNVRTHKVWRWSDNT